MGATDAGMPHGNDEKWEVWWCYDGWHLVADRLQQLLEERAPWATLRRMDPSRPLAEQVARARVLVPTTGAVCARTIAAASDLRLIAQPAAGYDNIDVAAAHARGVPVTIAPGYNSAAVAEAALMMLLMLWRRVDEARAAFERCVIGEPAGTEACGKRLGIIGLGRVGGRLARAASALGMEVVATTSASSKQDLDALLSSCQAVSIHCPATPSTVGLLGARELALMPPGALLINCARGEVVDRAALWEALQEGRLGGVGLDVHWVEPADPNEPIYRHPRVLALPHLGSVTGEVFDRFAGLLCENIVRIREGRELLHQLEPPR